MTIICVRFDFLFSNSEIDKSNVGHDVGCRKKFYYNIFNTKTNFVVTFLLLDVLLLSLIEPLNDLRCDVILF